MVMVMIVAAIAYTSIDTRALSSRLLFALYLSSRRYFLKISHRAISSLWRVRTNAFNDLAIGQYQECKTT